MNMSREVLENMHNIGLLICLLLILILPQVTEIVLVYLIDDRE